MWSISCRDRTARVRGISSARAAASHFENSQPGSGPHFADSGAPGHSGFFSMESDTIRIRLRVLPLRKAALGETVRVVDSTTHRVLLADVTGEGMLALHLSPPGAKK
jgi:hypothetical protein